MSVQVLSITCILLTPFVLNQESSADENDNDNITILPPSGGADSKIVFAYEIDDTIAGHTWEKGRVLPM